MAKKRKKSVTSATVIPQLVFSESSNSNKTSEAGFSWEILGSIAAPVFCGDNKQVMVCNSDGSVQWVRFGPDDSPTELEAVADAVTEATLLESVVDADTVDVDGATGTITSATATFQTNGVQVGDNALVLSGNDTGTYVIVSVDSENQLTVATPVPFVGDVGQGLEVRSVTLGTITSATATFQTNGVLATDTATISGSAADDGSWPITVVVSETELTVDVSTLPGGFTGDAGVNLSVTTLIAAPTAFANGIMLSPNQCVVLASGSNTYVRASDPLVGAYVATEDISSAPDQPEV